MREHMGTRVRRARKAEGLSQEQLAKKVGVTQPTISDIEKGIAKTTRIVVVLAQALRRRPQWLEFGTGPEMLSEGDWPFSTPRQEYEALSRKAKAKIDEFIADQAALEGRPPPRKSDRAA